MKRAALVLLVLATVLLLAACSEENTEPADGDAPEDGDGSDGDAPQDGDLPDGDTSDGDLPDGELPDGDLPDGDLPDGDNPADGDDPGDGDDDPQPIRPECEALASGWNRDFMVDERAREFLLHLPTNVETGGPWPVIFNWHGLGDTATNMAGLLSGSVNNAVMPFILVTPEDLGFMPLTGLDWAILSVTTTNPDARLFDEILSCLDEKWGIDPNHIHSTGFSAGSIMTDVLGTVRADVLASTFTFSGAYFSNPANASYIGGLVSWPAFETANKFAQVMIHGGEQDVFDAGMMLINFNTMGNNDVTWFNGQGHDLIHCDHGGGHTVPVGTYPMPIVQFFADHPKGVSDSPYVDGLPASFPDYCTFMGKN